MTRSSGRILLLLGGPPGVGKSTILRALASTVPGCLTVDADDVWSPATFTQREQDARIGMTRVADAVQSRFDVGGLRVVLAWVFARAEMFTPFHDQFSNQVDEVRRLYLVASPQVLQARLAERGEQDKLQYACSRLELIRELPCKTIDTSFLAPDLVAAVIRREMHWPGTS